MLKILGYLFLTICLMFVACGALDGALKQSQDRHHQV